MDAQTHAAFQQALDHLNVIQKLVVSLTLQGSKIMAALDALTAEVARQTTVNASVLALLNGLVAKLAALAAQPTVDPAALQALVEAVKANDDGLAAAVTANTPAA
jgi:hypothetical protein